jgi:hypothetical protein
MFVYEKGNSLNLTFKGSIPVDNPEVVIKGYEDGATLTVNGTVYGNGAKEFKGRAKTFVFQKDNKLMITFKGIAGIKNPEVTFDETEKGVVNAVVCGTSVTINYTDEEVTVGEQIAESSEIEEEPQVETPVEEDVPAKEDVVEPVDEELPEEPVEE